MVVSKIYSFQEAQMNNKYAKGADAKGESITSSIPPKPGIFFAEYFCCASRFIIDSIKSPNCPVKARQIPKIIAINQFIIPKPAEKPPEGPEPNLTEHSERTETRKAPNPKKVEANPAEENQPRENPAAENPKPQGTQDNQGNIQRGIKLDIMA